jgi:hypothetical protein
MLSFQGMAGKKFLHTFIILCKELFVATGRERCRRRMEGEEIKKTWIEQYWSFILGCVQKVCRGIFYGSCF